MKTVQEMMSTGPAEGKFTLDHDLSEDFYTDEPEQDEPAVKSTTVVPPKK